jgi:hypothetical protein
LFGVIFYIHEICDFRFVILDFRFGCRQMFIVPTSTLDFGFLIYDLRFGCRQMFIVIPISLPIRSQAGLVMP